MHHFASRGFSSLLVAGLLLGLIGACKPLPETIPPAAKTTADPPPPASPRLIAVEPAATAPPEDPAFQSWLEELAREARTLGIRDSTLAAALQGLQPLPQVVTHSRQQAEFVLATSEYVRRMVSEHRIREGRRHRDLHANLLQEVEEKFGVPHSVLLALWAIESDFGQGRMRYPIVDALATQAYQGRRQSFFRKELLAALTILDQEHLQREDLRGSWAGATGQVQFLPSSYLAYAVDFNGDGQRDIWNEPADILASAANYLVRAGWKKGLNWGMEVSRPAGFDPSLAGLDQRRSPSEWRQLGIREASGPDDRSLALLLPDGATGPAFLVSDNFRTLLRWNRSIAFALAVSQLAERIAEQPTTGASSSFFAETPKKTRLP